MGMEGRLNGLGAVGFKLFFDNGQEASLLGMEEAVGADLLEATRQHMLKEAGDEPLGGKGGGSSGMGFGVPVSEGDLFAL